MALLRPVRPRSSAPLLRGHAVGYSLRSSHDCSVVVRNEEQGQQRAGLGWVCLSQVGHLNFDMFSPPVNSGKTRPTTLGSSQFSGSVRPMDYSSNGPNTTVTQRGFNPLVVLLSSCCDSCLSQSRRAAQLQVGLALGSVAELLLESVQPGLVAGSTKFNAASADVCPKALQLSLGMNVALTTQPVLESRKRLFGGKELNEDAKVFWGVPICLVYQKVSCSLEDFSVKLEMLTAAS
ncbi:hypothetical protein DV515_00006306 [Chloebia gouldiae]|uniref:Uncharacterized protein n=1 Tax=Chloebia gouldiae TaxID=44316 RepID=A0A3L8SLL8_CHLGU|nr:hypothetical protein DV515_00006306 [Chloebia gouldiae]